MIPNELMENKIILHFEFKDTRKECLEVQKDTSLYELKEILQDKFEVDAKKIRLVLIRNCKFHPLVGDAEILKDFKIENMNNIFVGY